MEKIQYSYPKSKLSHRLAAAGLVVLLSFSYRGCKGQLIELLKAKTELIDTDTTDVGVIANNGRELIYIDHQKKGGKDYYNYVMKDADHTLNFSIDDDGPHGTLDDSVVDNEIAIYSLNKQLGEIIKQKNQKALPTNM